MGDGRSGAFRVPAPDARALVRWPDSFGSRFAVFVDTEEEFDWSAPFSRDSRGTSHMAAMPAVHARFADAGVPLIFMVDHPIADCPRATAILREILRDDRSAVGTQLHPWVNPPFDEVLSVHNSFVGNLPRVLEEAKLRLLTEAIEAGIGVRPLIYRAGRYGIGAASLGLLQTLGYRIDSSMRSRYDYSAEGGPDFSDVGNHAFRVGDLIELPLTTVFTGHARAGGQGLYRRLQRLPKGLGIASRARLLSRVALTPEDMPIAEALEAVRVALGEGVRLLNFSFHSPSIVPGHTPYVRDAADLAAFHRWWDAMLAELARRGCQPVSLHEIIEAACPAAQPSAIAGHAGGL